MPRDAVTAKIQRWRDEVLAWFAANPGATERQRTVEASLTAAELDRLMGSMWDYRAADTKHQRFPQTLPNLGQADDRSAPFDHGISFDWWGDCTLDEWMEASGNGASINLWVREGTESAPADLNLARLVWFPGSPNFRADTMGWRQVVDES